MEEEGGSTRPDQLLQEMRPEERRNRIENQGFIFPQLVSLPAAVMGPSPKKGRDGNVFECAKEGTLEGLDSFLLSGGGRQLN